MRNWNLSSTASDSEQRYYYYFLNFGSQNFLFFSSVSCRKGFVAVEMLGTSLQLRRAHGEDRFYIPVKARKNQNQQRQQLQKAKSDVTAKTASSAKSKTAISENRNPEASSCSIAKPSSEPSTAPSNLDRFLESTTPAVPAQYFSKV